MLAETIDWDARYTVDGYRGVAFHLLGPVMEWTEEKWEYLGDENDPDLGADDYFERTGYYTPDENPANYLYSEPEQVESESMVRAVMVGDDRVFEVDRGDLTPLGDLDYCASCGQVGCTHDGRDRT